MSDWLSLNSINIAKRCTTFNLKTDYQFIYTISDQYKVSHWKLED